MDDTLFFIIIIVTVFASAMLQTVFGFGFALMMMAVLPAFMSMNRAIVFSLTLAFFNNILMEANLFKKICWKELMPMLIPTIIVCIVTAIWAVNINTVIMYFLLGCMLLSTAIFFFIFSNRIHVKATGRFGVIMGTICGFLAGMFSVAGPTAALYFMPALEDKEKFAATLQAYFIFLNIANLGTRIITGNIETTDLPLLGICAVVVIIGSFLGFLIGRNVKGEMFKKCVYALVGLNGIWIIVSNIGNVF